GWKSWNGVGFPRDSCPPRQPALDLHRLHSRAGRLRSGPPPNHQLQGAVDMGTTTFATDPRPPVADVHRLDGDMVELTLLLPGWQLSVLEAAAEWRGLTAGQLVRRVIGEFLHENA